MHKSFYLQNAAYYVAGLAAILFVLSYFFPFLFTLAILLLVLLGIAMSLDAILLFGQRNALLAHREMAERFSLGDNNKVGVVITNGYGFKIKLTLVDEIPFQFQERNWERKIELQ